MNQRKIHIENVQIRIRRGTVADAREIIDGLGAEILRQTATLTNRKKGLQRIERLDVGKLTVSEGDQSAAKLRNRIAGQIAALIGKNIK